MKHSITRYTKWIIWLGIFLGWLTTLYIVLAQNNTELRFDDQLSIQFWSGIFNNRTDIDFKYWGNKKIGVFLPRSLQTLSSDKTIVLNSGDVNTCTTQIRGLYYNNERGERLWPLDQNTLTWLQAIDSSYNDIQLSWWLFTNCSGTSSSSGNVYGQITITYHNTIYYLIGGTDYNFTTNLHGTNFSGSLKRINNNLSWYLRDSYWGIWEVLWTTTINTGNVINPWALTWITISTWTAQFTWYTNTWIIFTTTWILKIINTWTDENTLTINTSGLVIQTLSWIWHGELLPPTILNNGDSNNAWFGEIGIPELNWWGISRVILFTMQAWATTDSLVARGGYFNISFVVYWSTSGTVLKLYRSENWSVWIANTPDSTCTLNSNLVCNFRTDHLSYFTTIQETITTGANNNWGGGMFTKDNCLFTTRSKNNLSGSNADNIDYSPSYYDKTCEGPKSKIQTIKTPTCTKYSPELNKAFVFARTFGITTKDNCTQANLYGTLLRKDLAKMMVQFAENAFTRTGILLDNPKCAKFWDISHETQDTRYYIQKICEYGLMWLESDGVTPQSTFNPYGEIHRGQFGTILSRFIWMLDYSLDNTSSLPYYTKHLQALKKFGIMKKIDTPEMLELRWWVLITMQRIYQKNQ